MNQPDLDFGFYRIMHARAEQVTRFLEDDLLAIVGDAFGRIDEGRRARFAHRPDPKQLEQEKIWHAKRIGEDFMCLMRDAEDV